MTLTSDPQRTSNDNTPKHSDIAHRPQMWIVRALGYDPGDHAHRGYLSQFSTRQSSSYIQSNLYK
jgi:hypothetical protein